MSDPTLWKKRQITATVLGAVLIAIFNVLNSFGMQLPIDSETTTTIAGGIIAVVNIVLTYTTTDKIGLQSKSETTDSQEN